MSGFSAFAQIIRLYFQAKSPLIKNKICWNGNYMEIRQRLDIKVLSSVETADSIDNTESFGMLSMALVLIHSSMASLFS
jgi:hypothetical protein